MLRAAFVASSHLCCAFRQHNGMGATPYEIVDYALPSQPNHLRMYADRRTTDPWLDARGSVHEVLVPRTLLTCG